MAHLNSNGWRTPTRSQDAMPRSGSYVYVVSQSLANCTDAPEQQRWGTICVASMMAHEGWWGLLRGVLPKLWASIVPCIGVYRVLFWPSSIEVQYWLSACRQHCDTGPCCRQHCIPGPVRPQPGGRNLIQQCATP